MFALLLVLSVLANAGWTETPKVDVINLVPFSHKDVLSFDGTMHPQNVAEISSLTGGRITDQTVRIGDWVNKNQVLMEIDKRRLLLTQKLSNIELEITTERLKVSKKTFARVRKMYADSLISEEDFDKSKYERVTAEAQYSAALANFEVAQLNLQDSYVRAPFAGQISTIHVSLGETVMAGTPLLRLAATDTLLIRATVNASDLTSLQLNRPARIIWAQEAKSFSAKLRAFTTVADPINHRYAVELTSPNPPKFVAYGALVQVELSAPNSLVGVLINSQALRSFGGKSFAYTVKLRADQYHLQKTPVTVLRELDDGIFLIGEGLTPGQQIAAGGALMTDGLQIRIGNSLRIEP
ncbi:MAG: efflux RND transporter periplasmic adaptor subunit [Candidatus Latescibacterota bacterium]|nr:efflux RND transporter periplasmic adaptor subunit [Candidatus Latescibacterota bacterium]